MIIQTNMKVEVQKCVVSVILCSYNPNRGYIERVLSGLRNQDLSLQSWELIVVDNGSTNGVLDKLDYTWHPRHRILRENKLGLTHARLAGIRDARSDLLVFVDDDNILNNDYLSKAVDISNRHPFLGAWGGKSIAEFEVQPPEWFTVKHLEMLAIRDVPRDEWSNQLFNSATTPIGAGLVLRKIVAERYASNQHANNTLIVDRQGNQLLSGGDTEMAYTAFELNLGSGRFKELALVHLIPIQRVTDDYIVKLTESIALSNVLLFQKYGLEYSLPPRPKGRVTSLLRWINFHRMPLIKRRLILAEETGIIKGKAIVNSSFH